MLCSKECPIGQRNLFVPHTDYRLTLDQRRPALDSVIEHPRRGGHGINHTVAGNQQATCETLSKGWFGIRKRLRIQDFCSHPVRCVRLFFISHVGELFFIRGNPHGPSESGLAIRIQLGIKPVPEVLGILGQSELSGRIVHGDNMSHASGS